MEFISALVEVFHIDDREQFAAVHLPFVERFVRSHDHDGCGRKSQIQQVESFAVGVGGGEPIGR